MYVDIYVYMSRSSYKNMYYHSILNQPLSLTFSTLAITSGIFYNDLITANNATRSKETFSIDSCSLTELLEGVFHWKKKRKYFYGSMIT